MVQKNWKFESFVKKTVLTDTQYVNVAECEFIFLDVTFNYGWNGTCSVNKNRG